MSYKHLSIDEREALQKGLWAKQSVRAIARTLRRSPSSVSREIKRNPPPVRWHYTPRLAQARALANRHQRGREERLKNDQVRIYVRAHLKLGWSPEQIAGTSRAATGTSISYEAIYQYVYAQVHRNGWGLIRLGHEDLRPYLARHRKRRMKKGFRRARRLEQARLPSIDDRPLEVDARVTIGHWEDDLVMSRASQEQLKTISERASGLVFIGRVCDTTATETNRVVEERLSALPSVARKTLTRDRGPENRRYADLQKSLGIRCYFAHSYSAWERGSNENANGLIRRFFPKKTNFSLVSDEQIAQVEHLLNTRPRKRLGWKTPYQVFYKATGVALQG